MTRRLRLPGMLGGVMLVLAGCAPVEQVPDIETLADEMRPVVIALAELASQGDVPSAGLLDETTDWCGNPPDPEDEGKERYYVSLRSAHMESWGANGHTRETLTEAVRHVLVLPGWELQESVETASYGGEPYITTEFELTPASGGAYLEVTVDGSAETVGMWLISSTDCVPAAQS